MGSTQVAKSKWTWPPIPQHPDLGTSLDYLTLATSMIEDRTPAPQKEQGAEMQDLLLLLQTEQTALQMRIRGGAGLTLKAVRTVRCSEHLNAKDESLEF